MKKNTLVTLVAIIVVFIIVSVFVSIDSTSSRSEDQFTGQKIIPKLYDRLNDVTHIEITNNSGKIIIEKSELGWVIKSKDNYPGNVTQIRNTLVALAELEKVEAKTKKEKNYSKLGVQVFAENVKAAGQTNYIDISTSSEKLASIIIGNKKTGHTSRARGIKKLNYVRLTDEQQVWLVAGKLNLPALKNYMNTEITNIPVARIKQINITHPKGSKITISKTSKTNKEFTLKQLRKNKELSSPGILTSIASGLTNLNFDDVSNKTNIAKYKNPVKVQFTAFNGLTINLNVVKADNKFYLWLDAKSTKSVTTSLKQKDVENKDKTPDAKQEATDINKKHNPWLYIIPTYKGESLTKQLKDLVKTKEVK